MDYALAKSAKNRAAGIDDVPTEAWQWLDSNDAWTSQSIPQEWQTALVVEIYKGKGALDDPNNYRPISLLSTAYKLLARSLHFTTSPRHPQTSRKGRAR